MNVGRLQRFLQFAHPAADHWAWSRTTCKNKIRNPDLADELCRTKRPSVLIGKLKIGNPAVGANCAVAGSFTLPCQTKKNTVATRSGIPSSTVFQTVAPRDVDRSAGREMVFMISSERARQS